MIADAETDEPIGLVNLELRDDDVATFAYSVFPHTGDVAWHLEDWR